MGKHSVNRQLLLYGIVIIFNVQGNHPNEQVQLKERPTKYQASLGQLLDKNTNTAVDLHLGNLPRHPQAELMDLSVLRGPAAALQGVHVYMTASPWDRRLQGRDFSSFCSLPHLPIGGKQPLRWSPRIPASWNSYPVSSPLTLSQAWSVRPVETEEVRERTFWRASLYKDCALLSLPLWLSPSLFLSLLSFSLLLSLTLRRPRER